MKIKLVWYPLILDQVLIFKNVLYTYNYLFLIDIINFLPSAIGFENQINKGFYLYNITFKKYVYNLFRL